MLIRWKSWLYTVIRFCTFLSGFVRFLLSSIFVQKLPSAWTIMRCYIVCLGCVSFRFCQQNHFCTFLSAKTHTLLVRTFRTKSKYRTTTYTVKHHIQADNNYCTTRYDSKTYAKPYKNVQIRTKRSLCAATLTYDFIDRIQRKKFHETRPEKPAQWCSG